jgi:hypothetical protein
MIKYKEYFQYVQTANFSSLNVSTNNSPINLSELFVNKSTTATEWNFSKIKMKITPMDNDGWLMGEYINGKLKIIDDKKKHQNWDYIIKTNGQILVGIKHSWLSKGEDVLAAGELKYNNKKYSRLVEISNRSGHYLPSKEESLNFLRIFEQAGVKINGVKFTLLRRNQDFA